MTEVRIATSRGVTLAGTLMLPEGAAGLDDADAPDGDDALGEPAWEGGFCRGDGDEGDDGSVAMPT